ncbi:MAG: hypothetical protein QMB51_01810 [Patescibacteria group bacterium]
MSQKTNKKGLFKRKIISVIFLVSILFSQAIVPVSQANAMDINQLAANIVDITKTIGAQILKVGEGVLKAGIATTLNTFAQNLATATVTGMATGNWGAQPLFFQFPLEDMLQQTLDQVTGDYLDKLSETLKYDVCKPLNADLDWRFKIALNIIPQQADNSLNLEKPNCTLSKFVDAVNQSFDNISNALRKTFAADCFDEFLPKNISGASNPETDGVLDNAISTVSDYGYKVAGALNNFTYDGIKKYYLYDVPNLTENEARASYFIRKVTYYKQKKINPKCTSYKETTNGQPGSYFCKLSENKNANKTSNCITNFELNFNFSASLNLKGVCMLDVDKSCRSGADCTSGICLPSVDSTVTTVCSNDKNKLCLSDADCGTGNTCDSYDYSQGSNCISYELPDKINNVYQADKTKQRKFLMQYKTCYLTRMSAAFKNLIEVGQAPKQKIQDQKVKLGCTDIVDSLLTDGYPKNAAQFYSAYDLNFRDTYWSKDKILGSENPELYKTVIRSALLAKRGSDESGKELNSNGEAFLGYLKSKINFFEPFEQALVNCKSTNNGSGKNLNIPVTSCTNEEGEDGIVSSNDTSILDTSKTLVYHSDFSGLMIREGEMDSFGNTLFVDSLSNPSKLFFMNNSGNYFSVGLRQKNKTTGNYLSQDSNDSKIAQIKADLIEVCIKNATNQVAMLGWKQSQDTKTYIEQEKQKQLVEVQNKQEIVKANVAKSDVKPVTEPISHEIKSTPGMVTFNLEQALGSSSQMLQPTGDLFIDPIKIFLTTLLSEGSKKLMEGLFTRAFPTDGVDEDLAALDNIDTAEDVAEDVTDTVGEDNTCSVPGPLAAGSICVVDGKYENGVCQTCYCESRVGLFDSKGTTTYGTCQPKPSTR